MAIDKDQVRYLRGLAHTLNPIVMVGKQGVSQTLVDELQQNLARHELVKIRVQAEDRADRENLISELVKSSGAEMVQRVGHTATLYKRNVQKPKIHLPGDRTVSERPRTARGDAPPRRSDLSRTDQPSFARRASADRDGGGERASRPRSAPARGSRDSGTAARKTYVRREGGASAGGAERGERKPYVRRESGTFAPAAERGTGNPYARRDARDAGADAGAPSAERKPYARRESSSSGGA
ncbi:MAG: ribosome assembly RNA-binding protein YhbY, partial [Pseudomonadota bacterium]|nr:ribosome assembly RNA-binding protein YhbY [Pseudomonadota bacterium]